MMATGDIEVAQTLKVGGATTLMGDVLMEGKARINDDTNVGGNLAVTGEIRPSQNGGVVFSEVHGANAKIDKGM